jgi:hypothetical protein
VVPACQRQLHFAAITVIQPIIPIMTSNQLPKTEPKLPPEFSYLKRPKPRDLLNTSRNSLMFSLVWTLFSSIFLLVNLGGLIKGNSDYKQLTQKGVAAKATITKLEIDNSGDAANYHVYYQFMGLVNGTPVRFVDSASVSASLYFILKAEQEIDILYAASDPNLSAIKVELGPPNALSALIYIGMSSLFVLIGIGMLSGSLKAQKNLKSLRSTGCRTQAVIFDSWQDNDSNGNPAYFVAFAFKVTSLNGEQQTITRAEQNKILYDHYHLGDTLNVCYLPDNPFICRVKVE